ncbi:hypothetical protein HJFPF1_07579 [Paramyrothecium foliicola]|nr:hypothetical protein HJFPF1_07579 [Paramyrothecium foliicola]
MGSSLDSDLPSTAVSQPTNRNKKRTRTTSSAEEATEESERDQRQSRRTRRSFQRSSSTKKRERSQIEENLDSAARVSRASLIHALTWIAEVVGLTTRLLKKPFAFLAAVYLALGGCILLMGMVNDLLNNALSPLCSIPGVHWFNPACAAPQPSSPLCHLFGLRALAPSWCDDLPLALANETESMISKVEELVRIHGEAGQILEASVEIAGLPDEMQRSDSVMRDLENIVRYSQLERRDELSAAFNEYIEISWDTIDGLLDFSRGCDFLAMHIIHVNRYTMRKLQELEEFQITAGKSIMASITARIIFPSMYNEQELTSHYARHISQIIDSIDDSIVRAKKILDLLQDGRKHLALIHSITSSELQVLEADPGSNLSRLWSKIFGDRDHPWNKPQNMILLGQIDEQRKRSIRVVEKLTLQLQDSRGSLESLKSQIKDPLGPQTAQDQLPLSVHISLINESLMSLEASREWSLAEKRDRVQAVKEKLMQPEPFIEAKKRSAENNVAE